MNISDHISSNSSGAKLLEPMDIINSQLHQKLLIGACLGKSVAFDEIPCSVFKKTANCAPNELPVELYLDPMLQCFAPDNLQANEPETEQYFYHPDHLGSSSFISDAAGQGYQHLQYMPFGETFVSQKINTWSTPYQFSAKEKDDETGFSYFGARYYNSDVSVWLSVDPMSDERSWVSPYNYCQGRPLVYIDPSGLLDGWYENEKGHVVWNKDINSQKDLTDRGIKGKYIGQTTRLYCEEINTHVFGNVDGTISCIPLNPVIITPNADGNSDVNKVSSIMFYTNITVNSLGLMSSAGEQYIAGSSKTIPNIGWMRTTGKFCFWTGAFLEGVEGGKALYHGDYEIATKSGLDVGMSALATWGGLPGLIIGGGFFLNDACGVFDPKLISLPPIPPAMIVQDKTYSSPYYKIDPKLK